MRPTRAMALVAALLALPWPAWAGDGPAPGGEADGPRVLEVSWPIDLTLVALAGGGWLGTELAKGRIAPETCRWCARNGLDDAVTRGLSWKNTKAASTVSDVFAFGVLPALTLAGGALAGGADGKLRQVPADAVLVLEAVLLSGALNQAIKLAAGRERPFVARLPADQKPLTDHPSDNNLSFYSGHTGTAVSLVVSAAMVAHLRGYRAEPYIWAVGMPLALFVAYGRIAAQKHYLSDVLVGGGLGAAAGLLVPWLHRVRARTGTGATLSLSLSIAPGGVGVAGTFW